MTANIFIILTILLWGIGGFLAKIALKGFSGIHIYFLEAFGTLTVTFFVMLFFKHDFTNAIHNFKWLGYLFGIMWGIGSITFVLALKNKPANIVVPLTALYPLVTIILAVLMLKEPLTLRLGVGISLAIAASFFLF